MAVPALAAGGALALSLPPWGWWPLAFAGAALLYWRLRGAPMRTRLLAGWLAGLGAFVPGLWWAGAFNWYGAAVLMLAEAISMALAAACTPAQRGRPAAFVAAFTLAEALRMSWPFGGLPLGGVFLGQATGPFLVAARLGGPLLLTALVWLGGAGLGELVPALARRVVSTARRAASVPGAGGSRAGAASLVAGGVPLLLLVGFGIGGAAAPDGGAAVGQLPTAVIQGGGRRGFTGKEIPTSRVFSANLAAMSAMERRHPGAAPRLVVWPEDVVSVEAPVTTTAEGATMATIARRLHTVLLAGVTRVVSPTAFRNELVAWGPRGRIVAVFEKVHRVPFGEYVPDRAFFSHLASLSAVPMDAVPGHASGLLHTPDGPLGAMVSYGVFFADRGRSAVQAGARVLVVPTNTSSYSSSQVPTQEVAADRVQAVEEGRDLVQAAPTGFSTVVGPDGRVLARSRLDRRQVILTSLPLRSGHTIFEQAGEVPVLVLAALALVLGWSAAAAAVRWWRPGRADPGPDGTGGGGGDGFVDGDAPGDGPDGDAPGDALDGSGTGYAPASPVRARSSA